MSKTPPFSSEELFKHFDSIQSFSYDTKDSFDYHEKISDLSKYKKGEIFEKDFGNGKKRYTWVCINNRDDTYSAGAERNLSKEEREAMIPFCRCEKCTSNTLRKFLICSCCVGCINQSLNVSNKVIKETEEYMKLNTLSPLSRADKIFNDIIFICVAIIASLVAIKLNLNV